ncbi:OmpH family outer membrane protein [Crenalkalicoccus roseus]|uniref:OmpH family outer membrane protein n=1 Tax=Crenalkalicoccus roseus TaxID=1485588 RepID=UPI001081D254|nr:OmpH family outer membrane protein [Crenalkalicoccus roseus]
MVLSPLLARALPAASALFLAAGLLMAPSASAQQQQQEWFIPGQGQQRPAQAQPQQRPAQAPQQRPAQAQRPPALPPGQPPPAAVIGLVDVQEIQRQAVAFNQVRDEIGRRQQKLHEDLQREQTSWREAQQQLANERASLPADQLRQRERDLQDRITESQRIFRERNRAIEQAAQQALLEIERTMGQVIQQVAASRNVNLVLRRELVIFNDAPFDLTDEVVRVFNTTLRSVTIPPEPSAEATPPAAQRSGQSQQPQQQRR